MWNSEMSVLLSLSRLSCGETRISIVSAALHECVYRTYDLDSFELTEVFCTHVGDVLMGGAGAGCRASADQLRKKFRKWNRNSG